MKTNNPIDFAALTITSFAINPAMLNTAGPNNLDVNGGSAFGAFAGVSSAPAGGLIVSGNVGVGTSATASLGYLTVVANTSPSQSLLYVSGTSNFATTTNAGAVRFSSGGGATAGSTVTNGCDIDIEPNFTGNAGTITNACGLFIGPGTVGSGTNATITNAYAIYATTPTYGGAGTNLYTAYFQGNTGFNTPTPVNLVDINGAVAIGSYAGVNTAPTNGLIVSGLAAFGTSMANSSAQVTIAPNLSNSATMSNGLVVGPTMSYSTTVPVSSETLGIYVAPNFVSSSASGIITTAIGMSLTPTFTTSGTGSIGTAYGLFIDPVLISGTTGTTTQTVFGLYISPGIIVGSPAPTTNTGLYVAPAAGATQNYTAYFGLSNTGGVGINANPINALDVAGNTAIGAYAGVNAAPAGGLIVSGSVGIGTASPSSSVGLTIGMAATTTTLLFLSGTATNNGANINLYSIDNVGAFSINGTVTSAYGIYSNHPVAMAANGTLTNFYTHYYDTNTLSLGSGATITNCYNLYVATPTIAKNNYCAYFQGVVYMPSGWTIGQPGGTTDICATYIENATYTPTLTGSTTAGTTTYTTQAGFYTQIGRRVFVDAQIVYTNATGTGNMQFSVPLAARTVTNMVVSGNVSFKNVTVPTSAAGALGTAATNPPSSTIASGASVMTFFSTQNAAAGASVAMAAPSASPGTVQVSINYLVN